MSEPQSLITADELSPTAVILDVREPDEWTAGHIAEAVHVPMGSVVNRMLTEPGPLLSDEPIVVTCKAGGRASRVAQWLNANGFAAVVLDGGMLDWQSSGRPMVSGSGETPTVL
ncbi:MAG: Rhodanese domain protein [Pseudonocardiales bacterium]|nr:Rhodanese domain protein [Pseudonocardiales bacterium]